MCGYSQGFSGEGASNDSGVIENVDFHGFGRYVFGTLGNEANINTQYYLVPCRLSSDPKYTTLNDLDGLFGVKLCFRVAASPVHFSVWPADGREFGK